MINNCVQASPVAKTGVICGVIRSRRLLGRIGFLEIVTRYGPARCVVGQPDCLLTMKSLRVGDVVRVVGEHVVEGEEWNVLELTGFDWHQAKETISVAQRDTEEALLWDCVARGLRRQGLMESTLPIDFLHLARFRWALGLGQKFPSHPDTVPFEALARAWVARSPHSAFLRRHAGPGEDEIVLHALVVLPESGRLDALFTTMINTVREALGAPLANRAEIDEATARSGEVFGNRVRWLRPDACLEITDLLPHRSFCRTFVLAKGVAGKLPGRRTSSPFTRFYLFDAGEPALLGCPWTPEEQRTIALQWLGADRSHMLSIVNGDPFELLGDGFSEDAELGELMVSSESGNAVRFYMKGVCVGAVDMYALSGTQKHDTGAMPAMSQPLKVGLMTLALSRWFDLHRGADVDGQASASARIGRKTRKLDHSRRLLNYQEDAHSLLAKSYVSRNLDYQAVGGLQQIESVMRMHALDPLQASRIIALATLIDPAVGQLTPDRLFQLVWSLLGSRNVKVMAQDESLVAFVSEQFVGGGIVTEVRQLQYLYPGSLMRFSRQLPLCTLKALTRWRSILRSLLAKRPTQFSTLLDRITDALAFNRADESVWTLKKLLLAADLGLVTPRFHSAFSRVSCEDGKAEVMARRLAGLGRHIFPNVPLDCGLIADAVRGALQSFDIDMMYEDTGVSDRDLCQELVFFLYRPVTLDFESFSILFSMIEDRCDDLADSGFGLVGSGLDDRRGSFQFTVRGIDERPSTFLVYVSKNRASFFAKASAGICTGDNVELFANPLHFHLNLVDEASGFVVGNVQLYINTDGGRRDLIVRGVNPSSSVVSMRNADEFTLEIFTLVGDIARAIGLDRFLVSSQHGLWNVNSSRPEIRSSLNAICDDLKRLLLRQPLKLYPYYDIDVVIDTVFVFPLHRLEN